MLSNINIDPVAFTIPIRGGFDLYWYGIVITLGIAIGSFVAAREIEKRGHSADEYFNGLLIAIVSGYLFARLTYVLLDVMGGRGGDYNSLLDVLNIRAGGVNILGGFIGAAVVTWLYTKFRKLSVWDYADVTGLTLLLAQSIGRWGNFINQELYGPPTDLPWGISIEPRYRLPQFRDAELDQLFHPTFLYESLLLLLGFIVLMVLNNMFREKWKAGTLFGAFLVWWGIGRFIVEFFRPDQLKIGDSPITYSMIMALGIALSGVLLLLNRFGVIGGIGGKKRKKRPTKPKPVRSTK